MSETLRSGMVWRIRVHDAVKLGTDPQPYYANSDAERDWFFEHLAHRPREEHTVEQVTDPLGPTLRGRLEEHRRRAMEARKGTG